jgi:hypothetical protein
MGIMKKFFEKIKYNDVFFKFQKYFCNFSDFTIILLEAWKMTSLNLDELWWHNILFTSTLKKKQIFFATKHV